MKPTSAKAIHAVVAVVALFAVLWQLALIVNGEAVLNESSRPDLAVRLARFVSYFTVLSNLLVLGCSVVLARNPAHDGLRWRVVRMATIVSIAVTGVVHWFLLRPLLDLTGSSYVVDKLLHVVVPLLAVGAWFVAGPRGQAARPQVLGALIWPLLWGAFTLVRGSITGWWPYPFMNIDTLGWGRVLANLGGVAVLFAVVGLLFV
ncbi:MAG: Pr6Pr family membrane protein, partial [Pedococcus sp.]